MRKRNCKKFFDTLMWTTIYMLPIFIYLLINYAPNLTAFTTETFYFTTLQELMTETFGIDGNNLFFNALNQLFGIDGLLPMFYTYEITGYLAYLISVNILHLFVDIILALPRFCHKFLDKFAQDEE